MLIGQAVDVFILEDFRTDPLMLKKMYSKLKELLIANNILAVLAVPNAVAFPYWINVVKFVFRLFFQVERERHEQLQQDLNKHMTEEALVKTRVAELQVQVREQPAQLLKTKPEGEGTSPIVLPAAKQAEADREDAERITMLQEEHRKAEERGSLRKCRL